MCGNALEHFKVGRKGLGGASGVVDNDIDAAAGGQTKGHGHAMIVVGFNEYIVVDLVVGRWINDAIIVEFFDLGS